MLLFKYTFIPLAILYTFIFFKNKNINVYNNILKLVSYSFGIYIILIIGITLFPLPIQAEEIATNIKYNLGQQNNFIPLKTTYMGLIADIKNDMPLASIVQILGNILLFIPIGFYLPILKNKNLKDVAITGFILSMYIESTQLLINTILGYNYRSVDVDDIILNISGALLGYLIFKIINPYIRNIILNKN